MATSCGNNFTAFAVDEMEVSRKDVSREDSKSLLHFLSKFSLVVSSVRDSR